jgi:hypothetical protein
MNLLSIACKDSRTGGSDRVVGLHDTQGVAEFSPARADPHYRRWSFRLLIEDENPRSSGAYGGGDDLDREALHPQRRHLPELRCDSRKGPARLDQLRGKGGYEGALPGVWARGIGCSRRPGRRVLGFTPGRATSR